MHMRFFVDKNFGINIILSSYPWSLLPLLLILSHGRKQLIQYLPNTVLRFKKKSSIPQVRKGFVYFCRAHFFWHKDCSFLVEITSVSVTNASIILNISF